MIRKYIGNIRHHARKHEEAHLRLKELLSRALYIEKVWGVFVATFVITIVTVIIFLNWDNINSFFTGSEDGTELPRQGETIKAVHGFQSGVLATYQINGQTADQYIRYIRRIPGGGYAKGIETAKVVGSAQEETTENRQNAFIGSILLSTELSKGYHLTPVRKARSLQKSVLATYYLGEKTINIDSTLQTDARLLGQISNALSVDIFQYLNQAQNRADALDNYLNLLGIMNSKAIQRAQELTSVINFLQANFQAKEVTVGLTEAAFFENLKIFDGENAEEELGNFIGLQKEQTEVRAKIGAYEGLKGYYDFFIPKLDNLTRAIKANRDPLIAGVKVVEIQNMTLPLIIREP
ncbi:hypothetical protein KJ662_03860 [Patescibacteria group bacterium]|nr:hypothetical protein [Patescibacteria group bacterium]MBU1685365.1 hypothetical protein [Patescibacteria group bacterium]